ncbi:DUF6397 family protein [Streptomyces sp. AK02-01A]|uniref:DUF6397 family protein n=1 Tax=Streptomyces sp. AK02-01A TaxID=3028648 RepID=UPI0029A84362|nr:DUF6397 family protein [Streptomyces sp. AK02-01A]MDX3849983.1 DUF6397 family protein [Streptomyces sp. AK02-01A]
MRAARELELRRGEFALAVRLGHIRTTAGPGAGRRQVSRQEIERVRAADGFPDALRERVRTVGTAEAAKLMTVSPGRFTRLARAGCVTPVRLSLNRYRAIVWLYLAEELRAFAAGEPALLAGRLPPALRACLDEGEDRRPRNWRSRRVGFLLREREDPWERAAAVGCVLGPVELARVVADPSERACLHRLRPDLAQAHPVSEAAQATVRSLLVADRPDEVRWYRASLTALLEEARRALPAACPGGIAGRRHDPAPYAAEPAPRGDGTAPPVRPSEPPPVGRRAPSGLTVRQSGRGRPIGRTASR